MKKRKRIKVKEMFEREIMKEVGRNTRSMNRVKVKQGREREREGGELKVCNYQLNCSL
jgi:hypothetical protein